MSRRYFFMHQETFKVCPIVHGRSLWEDHRDKASWIVVREVGPSLEHFEEAFAGKPTPDPEIRIRELELALLRAHARGHVVEEDLRGVVK